MQDMTTSARIVPDTRFRVTPFANSSDPFISLRIAGGSVEIALLASRDASKALRDLAAAAIEAADALDAMGPDEPEVISHG